MIIPRFKGELVLDDQYLKLMSYLAGILNSTTFDFLIRRRITMHLNFFTLSKHQSHQERINTDPEEIAKISARLSSPDRDFKKLAEAASSEYGAINVNERIELTAHLDALVAHQYGLNRDDDEYIIQTFDAFREDKDFEKQKEIKWTDTLIKKFNGEVRKKC